MLLIIIVYYVKSWGAAEPNAFAPSADSRYLSTFFARGISTDVCPRTRLEIIWSCVATILVASWASVHPNLPHPQDSKFKKTLRRVELMLWAIITPELIIFWALRQWYGARQMEREFSAFLDEKQEPKANVSQEGSDQHEYGTHGITAFHITSKTDRSIGHGYLASLHKDGKDNFKWTRTHGFFLQMGGFVLYEKGKRPRVLGWEHLIEHYKAGRINLSDVTEARINDHSKADGFTKGLALLQTTWFIIQCIARFSDHHLALTEIELVTAALAALSLVMYFLWWNKPFNAEIPIVLTLSDFPTCSSINDFVRGHQESTLVENNFLTDIRETLWNFKNILGRIRELIHGDGAPDSFGDPIANQETPIMKVPTFYSITAKTLFDLSRMRCASFFIAATFGAIHCAGWSTKIVFSSHATSILWRASSAMITGTPLVWTFLFVFGYAGNESENDSFSKQVYGFSSEIFLYLTFISIPFYIISRVVLLTLALVELRSLPPGALATVQWANFVPFIH